MGKTIHGLDMFHIALLKEDSFDKLDYEAPERLAGAVNVSVDPKSESNPFYADNGTYDIINSLGDIDVDMEMADLPLDIQEKIYGMEEEDGVQFASKNDQASYLALAFRAQVSNSNDYRYYWLLKGMPSLLPTEHKTDEGSADPQTSKVTLKFMPVEYGKQRWKSQAQDGVKGFTGGANWFKQVVHEGKSLSSGGTTTLSK
ncbi:phage tail protein [Bacillus velezensis]|uniref:major tail protein n=1 Tax=Bacillus amyloliquefaciens group TaxID=1938374 RepID=UPI000B93C1E0|nr:MULTISPECIES: major tail protein [Bacillus amyloliquefaciens group]MCR4367983.1 phage tail protein [Bacillus amyloliquefaciens]MCV3202437.1 phage tail protein [Bacillus velezensis]OYD12560.1 phage tail protein [Bacillus velezensis]PAK28388.1 phage tail protein [Bacillus velezensis]WNJ14790.1 phage tail protein [Bacillus velezensis]